MNDWQTVTLEDVTESINTGLDAIRRAPIVEHKTNLRCLRIQDISQNKPFDKWGYTEVKDSDFKKFQLVPNDIIMARTCSTGICYLVKKELPAVFNNGLARIRLKIEKVDPKFIYYVFKSKHFSGYIDGISGGTSVQLNMKIGDLLKYQFNLPPLSEQKEIARILSDLDKKIELNTQINQTLEQIAQPLFKSWFVDFDPVRAKVQALSDGMSLEQAELAAMQAISGKTPEELTALSQTQPDRYAELAETAKAFPCEMVEVDGVEVPKEWEVKRIDEVIQKIPVGKKYSSKTAFSEGLVPILDQGRSGVIGYHNDKPGVKASIEDPIIVFANHTCYMRLISYDFSAIQNVFAFKGKECNLYWLYLATLGKQEFVEYKGHFPDFLIKEIIVPPEELTELFGKYVKESFSKIFINDRENSNLAKIRDLLLPKLLNGGIQNE
jgi:type I restriction/modification specificity protein